MWDDAKNLQYRFRTQRRAVRGNPQNDKTTVFQILTAMGKKGDDVLVSGIVIQDFVE
jgi:hypothetical protein